MALSYPKLTQSLRTMSLWTYTKKYGNLGIPKLETLPMAIYDYAKIEQVFSLGGLLRYLRHQYSVTEIYRYFTRLLEDDWFVMEQAPVSQLKSYTLKEHTWRPTIMHRQCVWKQRELRSLDESEIRMQSRNKPYSARTVSRPARVSS